MAIYRGNKPLAGNGMTPFPSRSTNTWWIGDEDTGIQAYPEDIDVDEYTRRYNEGTLEENRSYNITGTMPRYLKNVIIPQDSWVGGNPAIATVDIDGLKSIDIVQIVAADKLSNDNFSYVMDIIAKAKIKRIVTSEGNIKFMAYGEIPLIDLPLDVVVFKTIPQLVKTINE